jgi:hypothetical protein
LLSSFPGTPSLTLPTHLWSGKHSIKKDDFLTTIVQVPPKQHIPIAPFDPRTQTEAFTVSLEGLKGVRSNRFIDFTSTNVDSRSKIASVEYSCPRPRVYAGTRRPEEAGACRGCGSSPTCPVNISPSPFCRKNSKSWQRPRDQLSHFRSAPPCPQHPLRRRRRNHLRSHHARAPPCQFPVASNANWRIMLSHSSTRRAQAQDRSQPVAVMAYHRRWAKCKDLERQKRASRVHGLGQLKSSV